MEIKHKKSELKKRISNHIYFSNDKIYPQLDFNSQNTHNNTEDNCNGLETDLESMTIIIARHFFNSKLNRSIRIRDIVCGRLSSANLKTCELTLSDGLKTTVFYNPKKNIARVQVRASNGTIQHCRYSYSCSTDGSLHLVELDCGGGME